MGVSQCLSLSLCLPTWLLLPLTLFLCVGEWFSFFINTPLLVYHLYRYKNRPVMSGPGLYDPTTILHMDNIKRAQVEGWIKVAFYILSFFYFIYGMIYSIIASHQN